MPIGFNANLNTRYPAKFQGPFIEEFHSRLVEIRDGTSQTVMMSEKLRSKPQSSAFSAARDMLVILPSQDWPTPWGFFDDCKRQDSVRGLFQECGVSWLIGSPMQTCFNPFHTPNAQTPDCVVGNDRPGAYDPPTTIVGARSNHRGGVVAALADGSVRFIRDGIDPRTWHALGTRSGGEVIHADW